MRILLPAAVAATVLAGGQGIAAEPESCRVVNFSDVGWTDITSTTATASVILDALGYEPDVRVLSIPVTYVGMKNGDIDAYLGDWQPSMEADRAPYLADGSIEVIATNLTGAKYTFAVPSYVAEAGVTDLSDLAEHANRFGSRIYGIEPGNNGNRMILDMIEQDEFGLGGWKLVESSEQGMLSEVARAIRAEDWIVFLGWEPHPMNTRYEIDYLSGADEFFGPDYGAAEVLTNIRAGYREECPNVTRFLENLRFSLDMENELMDAILNEGKEPRTAAVEWLREHPDVVTPWLEGVITFDGDPAESVVRESLGL